jgi:hypothetical protein
MAAKSTEAMTALAMAGRMIMRGENGEAPQPFQPDKSARGHPPRAALHFVARFWLLKLPAGKTERTDS